jgi:C4-dicarboxylate-specific signal transduction histidine kinase
MTQKREESLPFLGRITAGQCHDVTNALNIVNELAGLQQDLVAGAAHGETVDLAKLGDLAARIQAQVERAVGMLRTLNRFGHHADTGVCLFDVREVIAEIVSLATRAARLRQTRLVSQLPERAAMMEASPIVLERAIFACIETALAGEERQRREVTVACVLMGDRAEIEVMSADPIDQAELAMRLDLVKVLVGNLGGTLKAIPDRASRRFAIVVPLAHER